MPSSFATDLLGIPSAHRRMARQRSDNDRATRPPRTCRFRYARSSLLRTKAAIGRPTTLAITRPHHIDKSEAYNVMNFSSRRLVGKRLNYLKLIIPELQRIALLYQVEDVDASELEAADLVARGS